MLLHSNFRHMHMRSQSDQYDYRSHHWHMGQHHRGRPLEKREKSMSVEELIKNTPALYPLPSHPCIVLTPAKRGSCVSAVVQTVLAILSRRVRGQVLVLRDGVGVCAGEPERTKAQAEGGLRRLICSPVVGVQHGDAHLIEFYVIGRRANEAEVSKVLQGELGRISLQNETSLGERAKQLRIRYVQVALGLAEREEESQTEGNGGLLHSEGRPYKITSGNTP